MGSTKVQQLQLTQQNLQNLIVQKQQLESQMSELDSALTELRDTSSSYKVLGKIMVSVPKDKLKSELEDKKAILVVRLQHFNKQEEKIQNTIESLQKEVLDEIKNKES